MIWGRARLAQFDVQEKELDENTVLTREIRRLTVELHAMQATKQEAPETPRA